MTHSASSGRAACSGGLAHTAHAATTAPEPRPPAPSSALEEGPCGLGAGWRSGAWPKSRNACASSFEHPGRRLDMLIWEACALRHSCRHLLAKGGFRLCQAVYYRGVFKYLGDRDLTRSHTQNIHTHTCANTRGHICLLHLQHATVRGTHNSQV